MSLKLYKINTTLNHPDCMAGFKKNDDEIFSFFRLDIGNEEKIKRRRLEFVAGTGYTLENIEKTDYIFCPSALLFSKRFVEKIVKETIGVGVNEKAVLRFYQTALSFTSISIFPW